VPVVEIEVELVEFELAQAERNRVRANATDVRTGFFIPWMALSAIVAVQMVSWSFTRANEI
jgi:hypothetical protein